MTAIETLISVLCDPEGKCCISGSDDDRRLIESALAELSQATAAQADSVPAVSDLPPLPAPDLRDVGTKPQEIKEFLKGYATEYARTAIAASAPADSVQDDAARLDFLIEQRAYVVSDPDACPGYWLHWARPDGRTWVQGDEHPTPRAAIDAARKQGARWQSAVRALTLHI